MEYIKTLSAITLATVISYGCSSGGGDSAPAATLNGIYTGITTGGRGAPVIGDEIGIIYNNRMMVFSRVFDIQNMFDSKLAVTGTSFTGTLNVYSNKFSLVGTAELAGSFIPGVSVAAAFINATDSNTDDGTIALTANTALYNKASSSAIVTGSWQGTHGGIGDETTLAIDAAGMITGNDLDGCNFTGSIAPADTSINVYTVSLISTGCTSLSAATYTGFAWAEADEMTLNLTVADGTHSRSVVLTKL